MWRDVRAPSLLMGQEICILNMKVVCITYEVLRSYLFHFLWKASHIMNQSTISVCACYSCINLLDVDLSTVTSVGRALRP